MNYQNHCKTKIKTFRIYGWSFFISQELLTSFFVVITWTTNVRHLTLTHKQILTSFDWKFGWRRTAFMNAEDAWLHKTRTFKHRQYDKKCFHINKQWWITQRKWKQNKLKPISVELSRGEIEYGFKYIGFY